MHFKKFYCVSLFLSSMAMTSVCPKSICIYQDCRNKGFMFTIKEVWDQLYSPENQFFNISTCKWPSASSLKRFTWFWRVIDELLPIYFFIPSACPAQDVTNFIDFHWFRQSFWPLKADFLSSQKLFATILFQKKLVKWYSQPWFWCQISVVKFVSEWYQLWEEICLKVISWHAFFSHL